MEEKFRLIFETEGLDEIEKQITESVAAVEQLQRRKKELNEELKEGKISSEQYAKSILEINNEIKDYQAKIKSLTTTQEALKVANKEGALSYNDLVKLYKEAERQLRRLEGTLKVNEDGTLELNDAYKEQIEKVKNLREAIIEFDQAIKDGRSNVGNYKDAVLEMEAKLEEISGELKTASEAIEDFNDKTKLGGAVFERVSIILRVLNREALKELIESLKLAGKAILSNPLFLLVTVLVSIYEALKNTSKGFEALRATSAAFSKVASAVFKALQPLIDALASSIIFVAKGIELLGVGLQKAFGVEAVSTLSELEASLDKINARTEALSASLKNVAGSIDYVFELMNKRVGDYVAGIDEKIEVARKLSDELIKESEAAIVELTKSQLQLVRELQNVSQKTFAEFQKALASGAKVSEQELETYKKILELGEQIKQIDLDKYKIQENILQLEGERFGLLAERIDLQIQIKQLAGEINLEEGKGLDVYRRLKEQQAELSFKQAERLATSKEELENARLKLQLARLQIEDEIKQSKNSLEQKQKALALEERKGRINAQVLAVQMQIVETQSKQFFYVVQSEKVADRNRSKAIDYLRLAKDEMKEQVMLEYKMALLQTELIENEDERALAIKKANLELQKAVSELEKNIASRSLSIAVGFEFKQKEFDITKVQGNAFAAIKDFYTSEMQRLVSFKDEQQAVLQELLNNNLIGYQEYADTLNDINEAYIQKSKELQNSFNNDWQTMVSQTVDAAKNTFSLLSDFGTSAFEMIKAANQQAIQSYIETGEELPKATKNSLKAFFAIQKASAIANIVISNAQALAQELKNASVFPPPANVAYYAAASARIVSTVATLLATVKSMTFENALSGGISIGGGKGTVVEPKTLLGRQIIETSGSTTAQNEATITKNNDTLNQARRLVVDVKDIRQGLTGKARVEDNRTI